LSNLYVKNSISIVIPVFNNEGSLEKLFCEIQDSLIKFLDLDLEIIFVNDGSTDNSLEVLNGLNQKAPNVVTVLNLSRNFGQLAAMIAGFEYARGHAVINISADRQDPAFLILEMYEKFLDGYEIVIANRESRNDEFVKRVTSRIAYRFAKRANPNIPDGGFDCFLISQRANQLLTNFKGRYRFIQGDLLWLGLDTALVPYVRLARESGKSGYSFRKRLSNFLDLMIDSSPEPIKFVSKIGMVVSIGSVVYAVSIVLSWVKGDNPFEGWAPLMLVMLSMNGLTLLMLGLIGEYLWRMSDIQRNRPTYIVESVKARKND
jgi:glycosyltransferase involved in cell wall biosynthesis